MYLYYVQTVTRGMFKIKPYGHHKFIEELSKSNKGWYLSWFIATGAYDMAFLKLGLTPTQYFSIVRLLYA